MIKDWNSGEVKNGEVFHFQNSIRPFIEIVDINTDEPSFLDLDSYEAYTFDNLPYQGLEFYTKENDKYFYGVDVVGKISWEGED